MDERELENILVSRGALSSPCPACDGTNWTALQQRDLELAIPGEFPDGRKVVGITVVAVVCLKCGFVRLHAKDILTNEPYLSAPPETPEDA